MTSNQSRFFKFFFVFKIRFLTQYECMMSCNMSVIYVPHQKKELANIDGLRVDDDKTHIPVVSSNETILRNHG
jgi:hypothetical protein